MTTNNFNIRQNQNFMDKNDPFIASTIPPQNQAKNQTKQLLGMISQVQSYLHNPNKSQNNTNLNNVLAKSFFAPPYESKTTKQKDSIKPNKNTRYFNIHKGMVNIKASRQNQQLKS